MADCVVPERKMSWLRPARLRPDVGELDARSRRCCGCLDGVGRDDPDHDDVVVVEHDDVRLGGGSEQPGNLADAIDPVVGRRTVLENLVVSGHDPATGLELGTTTDDACDVETTRAVVVPREVAAFLDSGVAVGHCESAERGLDVCPVDTAESVRTRVGGGCLLPSERHRVGDCRCARRPSGIDGSRT